MKNVLWVIFILFNKKFMLIAIFLVSLLAISSVSATENIENSTISQDNLDDLSQVVVDEDLQDEANHDELSHADDVYLQESNSDELCQGDSVSLEQSNSDELKDYDEIIYFDVDMSTSLGGDTVTFECKNYYDGSPLSNLDLAISLDGGPAEKITTNSEGIATYSPASTGDHILEGHEWDNQHFSWYGAYMLEFKTLLHAKLTIINSATEYGDDNVTFKVTDFNTDAPLSNVELGILSKKGYSSFDKITTDSNGIAVWKLPFKLGSCIIYAGLLVDDDGISSQNDDLYCEGVNTSISITNIPATLKLEKSGKYYQGTTVTVSLIDSLNKPLANEKVTIKFSNGKSKTVTTNSNGVATYTLPFAPGKASATANVVSDNVKANDAKLSEFEIYKAPAKITPTKLSTTYKSGKYFQVKVINSKTEKAMGGVKLILKVYTGKKYKKVTVTTNNNGIAKYAASGLALGTHNVIVSPADTKYLTASSKKSSIKISKASISISAPKVTNEYKKSQTFKVTVKNKKTGAGMSGIKVIIKVYTGKKYKTFTVKTNSKGVATIKTNSLSKTTHNVVINVKGTSKYSAASKKSSIKIVKSKIATHFEMGGEMWYNHAENGVFSGVFVELKLFDSAGKEVGWKTVKMQIKKSTDDTPYGNQISVLSNSGFHDVSCRLTGESCYLYAYFAGDSDYKPCEYTYNLY